MRALNPDPPASTSPAHHLQHLLAGAPHSPPNRRVTPTSSSPARHTSHPPSSAHFPRSSSPSPAASPRRMLRPATPAGAPHLTPPCWRPITTLSPAHILTSSCQRPLPQVIASTNSNLRPRVPPLPGLPPLIASARSTPPSPELPPLISSADALVLCLHSWEKIGRN